MDRHMRESFDRWLTTPPDEYEFNPPTICTPCVMDCHEECEGFAPGTEDECECRSMGHNYYE